LEGNKGLRSLAGLLMPKNGVSNNNVGGKANGGGCGGGLFPHLTRLDCSHCDLDSVASLDSAAAVAAIDDSCTTSAMGF
jgi:hypothetical protein